MFLFLPLFHVAVLSSLKSISASHQQTLQESTPSVRAASYAICVVHGLLVSRQMFGPIGLSKLYSLNDCQVSHGIDVILGSKFKEQNGPKELIELGALISEVSQKVGGDCLFSSNFL